MSSSRRSWWIVYGACVMAVVLALAWISSEVLDLETKERAARADAIRQQRIRLALWRMDSWLTPLLAREAARPYFEYAAYYPENRAYNPILNRLDPDEVLTRSPLVNFESDLFQVHFQIDDQGEISSPQVPEGNFRELAELTVAGEGQIARNGEFLLCVSELHPAEAIRRKLGRLEEQVVSVMNDAPASEPQGLSLETDDQQVEEIYKQGRGGTARRAKSSYAAKNAEQQWVAPDQLKDAADLSKVRVGSLVPLWLGGTGNALVFVRRVRFADKEIYQGFLADWRAVRAGLLEQVVDLLPGASVLPVAEDALTDDETGMLLATVPVALSVPTISASALSAGEMFTPGRAALGVTWIAVLAAAGAVAMTLRSSIEYARKRSRFASTVTHELRTPLTTFRMYSEMLAEGMVKDEEQRAVYLRTLQDESSRLATLVENVLAYARLEDGRATARRENVIFADLARRVLPPLERRVADGEMVLDTSFDVEDAETLHVDVEAIGQVLFNLVDNACKYGRSADKPLVELSAKVTSGNLVLAVRDHGPGVPAAQRKAVFEAFDRGGRGGDDSVPGVGLGLALCASLASELGGKLSHEVAEGGGARFVLRVPV